jgi:hypothetical protein
VKAISIVMSYTSSSDHLFEGLINHWAQIASGEKRDREVLAEMMEFAREGDELIV